MWTSPLLAYLVSGRSFDVACVLDPVPGRPRAAAGRYGSRAMAYAEDPKVPVRLTLVTARSSGSTSRAGDPRAASGPAPSISSSRGQATPVLAPAEPPARSRAVPPGERRPRGG